MVVVVVHVEKPPIVEYADMTTLSFALPLFRSSSLPRLQNEYCYDAPGLKGSRQMINVSRMVVARKLLLGQSSPL